MARNPHFSSVPRLLRAVFSDDDRFRCGLVVEKNERGEEVLSERLALDPNYIDWIRNGFPRNQNPADPKTLLYLMLRHGALLEQARAGLAILKKRGLIDKRAFRERELVKIDADDETIYELLDRPVFGVTGGDSLGRYLLQEGAQTPSEEQLIVQRYREALRSLETLPTAELERLFTETLDTCAYRLDAWITSLATKKLDKMRSQQPRGVQVGAYGWVENLKAVAPGDDQTDLGAEAGVTAHTNNGGYVYAPSMTHAATAAVLRNAYMTRAGDQQAPFAINLSSARVRSALWLLDTTRDGQPLGAALGYLFERGLHEKGLDRLVDDFRAAYPLVANKLSQASGAVESIAARNVVDGYSLLQHRRDNGTPLWGERVTATSAEIVEVNEVLGSVDDTLDALADLLTAESVYQLVGGSVEGAGASLDAMAKGAHPPEPEVARWYRGGTSVTHRVALVLGDELALDDSWPNPSASPRARAEPQLNAWVGEVLGNPGEVTCRVSFAESAPVLVTLRDLGIQPLDVLALASSAVHEEAQASDLDRRVAEAGATALPGNPTGPATIDYTLADAGLPGRTFLEILEIARAVNTAFGGARALRPRDLLPPEEAGDVEAAGANLLPAEIEARASEVGTMFTQTIGDLETALTATALNDPVDASLVRPALRSAARFGTTFPPWHDTDLGSLAASVLADLGERQSRSDSQVEPVERLKTILGRDFHVTPRFLPAQSAELTLALGGPAFGPVPDDDVSQWLAMAARVRKPLMNWRTVSLYRTALGRRPGLPAIAQLPFQQDEPWVALRFDSPDQRPPAGKVSLALFSEGLPGATSAWGGLLLDEWNELIPNAKEDAGVVFHYDRPNAEAPQAMLLAVPPNDSAPWSLELLMNIVGQTLESSWLRGFDGEWEMSTGEAGHAFYNNPWLPMILMAENPEHATIATSFEDCMGSEEEQ